MNIKKALLALALFAGAGSIAALADVIIASAEAKQAKVYARTSTKSDSIAVLRSGEQGELIGENEEFYKIRLSNGTEGFVLKQRTERITTEDVATNPVTEAQIEELYPVETNVHDLSAEADVDSTMATELDAPVGNERAKFPCGKKNVTVGKKTYDVADIYDVRTIYKTDVNKANCFFVISKQEYRLYVYERVNKDTILVAHYPVCYAKRTGQKTKQGDMSTPDGDMDNYFTISQIANASTWKHDFKDGRGNIKAYGDWFMRLNLTKATNLNATVRSNRSIGIHGSSGNRESVPGNDSEGCIRLRDEDINHLKANFAQVGTKVVVKAYDKGKYSFEKRAAKALGNKYFYAKKGYRKYPAPTK